MVLHVTYLRCTVREICMLFSSVKLLGSRVRLSDCVISPALPPSLVLFPSSHSSLSLCWILIPGGEALLVLFFEVCVIWTLCPQCNSSIAISCIFMYIHYGETQQPYKREIKNCPNLKLCTLLELLPFFDICLLSLSNHNNKLVHLALFPNFLPSVVFNNNGTLWHNWISSIKIWKQ